MTSFKLSFNWVGWKVFPFIAVAFVLFVRYDPAQGANEEIRLEIPSSFNPVGSGARALGMGGAFMAIADDATAASWNPAGLVRVRNSEVSIVGDYFHRIEENAFGADPAANNGQSVSVSNLNYFSANWVTDRFRPFNMAFSINRQRLYDLNRSWNFTINSDTDGFDREEYVDYLQGGGLSAVGLAYSILIPKRLSIGVTLNIWDDDLSENSWEQKTYVRSKGVFGDNSIQTIWKRRDKYTFSGVNFNIGFLWLITSKLKIGGVLKTPFEADIDHEAVTDVQQTGGGLDAPDTEEMDRTLDMPLSFGLGLSYQISNEFRVAMDIYHTRWDDFVFSGGDNGKMPAVTGRAGSDVDPTTQARLGMEYRFKKAGGQYVFPVRCGAFYDPAPAEGSPDDFYGFSLGAGVTKFTGNEIIKGFSLDIAYQFRFGDDVGEYILDAWDFSQDVREHAVYSSLIVYF